MAETYRDSRDPYAQAYNNYYHHPHHHPHHQPSTPPSQSAALTSYNYHVPPSPARSSSSSSSSASMDYWYQHPSYQYPPTPTSPHSPYSPYSSSSAYPPSSPHSASYSASSSPRGAMPAIPDYLNSRESRPTLLLRNPYEMRQRVRRRRASASAVAALQTLRLVDLPEEDRCCNICMEQYIEDKYPSDKPKRENAMRMPCGHVFGSYCLKQWLQNHNTCPACRMEVDYVEVEEEEILPRSRAQRRPSLSTHELIVNDLFGEPYRDPAPPRSKTPHQTSSRSRTYFGNYEPEQRPGTTAPMARPTLKRTQTSMGSGTVRYPFARPPSEEYGQYSPTSPQRTHGIREAPYERPGSATSSGAATTQSEPTRSSDGYYSQPARNGRATPFRQTDMVCALESLGLCMIEEQGYGQQRLVRLDCGHGFHADCLYTSMKSRGDAADLGAKQLWCERCRRYLARKTRE